MLYLAVLIMFVFFAGVAMTIAEGLWSNTILLFLIMICGVLAFSVGAPEGRAVIHQVDASDDANWEYVMSNVWFIYVLSLSIMRALLKRASATKVKFVGPFEMVAGPVMGLFAAVMFTSFTAYTICTIPVQAGAWSVQDASPWVVSFFQYACAPFHNVLKAFAATEGLSSAFYVLPS